MYYLFYFFFFDRELKKKKMLFKGKDKKKLFLYNYIFKRFVKKIFLVVKLVIF